MKISLDNFNFAVDSYFYIPKKGEWNKTDILRVASIGLGGIIIGGLAWIMGHGIAGIRSLYNRVKFGGVGNHEAVSKYAKDKLNVKLDPQHPLDILQTQLRKKYVTPKGGIGTISSLRINYENPTPKIESRGADGKRLLDKKPVPFEDCFNFSQNPNFCVISGNSPIIARVHKSVRVLDEEGNMDLSSEYFTEYLIDQEVYSNLFYDVMEKFGKDRTDKDAYIKDGRRVFAYVNDQSGYVTDFENTKNDKVNYVLLKTVKDKKDRDMIKTLNVPSDKMRRNIEHYLREKFHEMGF